MLKGMTKLAAIGVLLAVPAVAMAGSTYQGAANGDPDATIELRISNEDDRRVTKVVVKGLTYSGGLCPGSGRTPKATLKDSFRVKGNGEFRAVGTGETGNPLTEGQITVVGDATATKVTGTMKFTYGKDGCQSDKLNFKAFAPS